MILVKNNASSRTWNGSCLDNEEQTTVIRFYQAETYCRYTCTKRKTSENDDDYKFLEDQKYLLDSMLIGISLPNHKWLRNKSISSSILVYI